MDIFQKEIKLKARARGFHIITDEIMPHINKLNINTGILNLFLKHSSASICINEDADPSVRDDLEKIYSEICDNKSYYTHTQEGDDDMPSHVKSTMIGVSLNIPITNKKLNLGTWQGIYLNEHRYNAGSRSLVISGWGI